MMAASLSLQSMCMCTCVMIVVCVVQEGFSFLILAIHNKHVDTVEILLNAKANPNITDNVSNE